MTVNLELEGVTVRLGGDPVRPAAVVLDGVSAVLGPGVTLLTGPNGAGKSTLLRVLAGIIRPVSGALRWQGRPLAGQLGRYRRRLGYLPQRQAAYPEMAVADFLDYIAALKAIPPRQAGRRRDELMAALGLADAAREPLGRLSLGQCRLVAAAQALLNDPDVLLLDEPCEGLDHDSRHRLLGLLHRPERITLMATHRLELTVPAATARLHLRNGKIGV